MTTGQRARRNFCDPVTNNLLRQIIKSVVGRFRSSARRAEGRLRRVAETNLLDEIDARTLEEFLISGCAVQRISGERRAEGCGPWADIVSPGSFFVNAFRDPRGHDIETIGMIHSWSLPEMLLRLGDGTKTQQARLADIYNNGTDGSTDGMFAGGAERYSFIGAGDEAPGRCRVIEVWTRHYAPVEVSHNRVTGRCHARIAGRKGSKNATDAGIHTRHVALWRGGWYSPDGHLLAERTAGRHPFIVKLYPLIDGEVHSFIEDIVDRQIQVNRTLTIVDRIMSVSAKELLLMPAEAVVGGTEWKLSDYARAWGTPGAVIPYRSGGDTPTVVNTAGINAGLSNLLGVELQMMEQVSGVSSALQGMRPQAGSTATLYNAQADNSAQALGDIFDTFESFRQQRDMLLEKYLPVK